jgi:hypothetical protein
MAAYTAPSAHACTGTCACALSLPGLCASYTQHTYTSKLGPNHITVILSICSAECITRETKCWPARHRAPLTGCSLEHGIHLSAGRASRAGTALYAGGCNGSNCAAAGQGEERGCLLVFQHAVQVMVMQSTCACPCGTACMGMVTRDAIDCALHLAIMRRL